MTCETFRKRATHASTHNCNSREKPQGERTLPILREAVQHCQGCDLYRNATQTVFGELETGASSEKPKVTIMMIGEQPGDQEDKQGRPVGRQITRSMSRGG